MRAYAKRARGEMSINFAEKECALCFLSAKVGGFEIH